MRRRPLLLAIAWLLVLAVALAGCSGSQGRRGRTGSTTTGRTIVLENLAFVPSSFSAMPGETIRIRNADTVTHRIMIGTTDLGVQRPGQVRSWTARQPNSRYVMTCLLHPSMTGVITVGSSSSTVGTPPVGGGNGAGQRQQQATPRQQQRERQQQQRQLQRQRQYQQRQRDRMRREMERSREHRQQERDRQRDQRRGY